MHRIPRALNQPDGCARALATLACVEAGAEHAPSLTPSQPAPWGCSNLAAAAAVPQQGLDVFALHPIVVDTHRTPQRTRTQLPSAMFRDFSFAPASPPSYSAYEADRAAMNVSPTSKPDAHHHYLARPPTPPCTIGDLASQLNQQSLRIDTRSDARCAGPLTPPSDDDSATDPAHPAPRPTYSRVSASLLRMQRQSTCRLQCSSSHVRDISRLVQMIQQEEQCTIKDAGSRSSSSSSLCSTTSSSSGDEGIDMDYDPSAPGSSSIYGMPQWKAGDLRDGFARVAKPVRMRRRSGNKVEKRRSS